MRTVSRYAFRNEDPDEYERLGLLERYVDPLSTRVMNELPVERGWRCADIGAGRGSIAQWLAREVGPDGEVVAVDRDVRSLRSLTHELTLAESDALDFASSAECFDLAHMRFLLVHVDPKTRLRLLEALRTMLRPGGAAVVVESDYSSWALAKFSNPLIGRVRDGYLSVARDLGWDLALGSNVSLSLERLGFCAVRAVGMVHYDRGGSVMCRLLADTITALSERLLRDTNLTENELAEFKTLLQDPSVGMPYIVTWATVGFAP
jgi:SAM-dependent methyltransferase